MKRQRPGAPGILPGPLLRRFGKRLFACWDTTHPGGCPEKRRKALSGADFSLAYAHAMPMPERWHSRWPMDCSQRVLRIGICQRVDGSGSDDFIGMCQHPLFRIRAVPGIRYRHLSGGFREGNMGPDSRFRWRKGLSDWHMPIRERLRSS